MLQREYVKSQLAKSKCHTCGESLEGGMFSPLSEVPLATIAHVVCPKCHAQSMVTVTMVGSGVTAVASDLKFEEVSKFVDLKALTYDEILDLHQVLKKENIWNLLQKKENKKAKK